MRALWPLLLLPALHSYYVAVPLIPRQHHRQLDVRLIAPTPLEPEIVAPPEEPPPPAAGLAGLVAPTSASSRLPALSADDLWGLLQGDLIAHLEPAERVRIRLAIDVLLSRISMAERAERACATTLRPGYSPELPLRSPPAEVLHVLSSVRTARDLLKLGCDAPTVVAALLSQVLTARTPTWPESRELPPAFKSEVSGLLDQQRAMRALGVAAGNLDEGEAHLIREAVRRGLGVRRGSQNGGEASTKLLEAAGAAGIDADGCYVDDSGNILMQADGVTPWCATSATSAAGSDGASAAAAALTAADPRALVVLLGGALAGLRASDSLPLAQQQQRALESVQVFAPLAHSVGLGGGAFAELESLSYARLFPESLRRLRAWYYQVWPDAETLMPQLCGVLEQQLRTAPSLSGLLDDVEVKGRVKSVTSTFRKLLRDQVGGAAADEVRDALALRVILTPADDAPEQLVAVRKASGVVELEEFLEEPSSQEEGGGGGGNRLSMHEAEALICFDAYRQLIRYGLSEVPNRFKDFVTRPKPNGYQSLHTNLRLPDGRVFEVQVRTRRMHEAAEFGSAAHNAYRAAQLGGSESTLMLSPAKEEESEVEVVMEAEVIEAPPPDGFEWAVDVSPPAIDVQEYGVSEDEA